METWELQWLSNMGCILLFFGVLFYIQCKIEGIM
jgi:hypothetical protein